MAIRCKYNYKDTGFQVFYDDVTFEIVHVNAPVFYKNDFLGLALDATNDVNTVTDSASATIAALIGTNGWMRVDSGTTADKQGGILSGMLAFEAENELIFQTRLHTTTSDANHLAFIGFTDDITGEGTGKIPLKDGSLASGSIDAWADDMVGFGWRTETSDNIYAVSCIAAGTPQTTDTGHDLVLGTNYLFELVLDSAGNCKYYINGAQVASHALAITPGDPLGWAIIGMITAGSTAALIDVDYVLAAQNRS